MNRINGVRSAAFAAVLGFAAPSFGQGQVAFVNSSYTLISTNAWHLGPALEPTRPYPGSGGPQFVYALFAAPSSVTSVSGVIDPNWIFTGAYATNTAASTGGRLAGGDAVLPPPYALGTTFNFLVRGRSEEIGGMDWPSVQAFVHTFEVDPNAVGSPGELFGTSGIATIEVVARQAYHCSAFSGPYLASRSMVFCWTRCRFPSLRFSRCSGWAFLGLWLRVAAQLDRAHAGPSLHRMIHDR